VLRRADEKRITELGQQAELIGHHVAKTVAKMLA
jgi:hypothetical protein